MGDAKEPGSVNELIETALAAERRRDDDAVINQALVTLQGCGTRDVLNAAVALSQSEDWQRRVLATQILGQLSVRHGLSAERAFPEECCDVLLNLVKNDADERVLASAVFALGHLGNRRCEPEVITLRHHPENDVRYGVAFALNGSISDAAVRAQLELMDDPYEMVRDWATTSIGQTLSIDGPKIREALLRRADDPDEITRAEALHGLARRRDERSLPYLIEELSRAGDRVHLFADAAQTFLGIDEDQKVGLDSLLSGLRAIKG